MGHIKISVTTKTKKKEKHWTFLQGKLIRQVSEANVSGTPGTNFWGFK